MAFETADLADLVATTQANLGELKWTDISSDYQEYTVLPRLLRKDSVTEHAGSSITFNLMKDDQGTAKNVGLFASDDYNIADVMTTGTVPWRHSNVNWTVERREVAMNRSPRRIVNLVEARRKSAMVALANLMETNYWSGTPTSSDKVTPYSVLLYIVKDATEGFNGGDPSGHSSGIAGISSSTETRWANWSARYTAKNKTDMIRKIRKAMVYTRFKPPVPMPTYEGPAKRGMFTNYDVLFICEELLEAQNENLGNDLASKDGNTMFRRTPLEHVVELDSDTEDPIYGIDFSCFHYYFLEGEYMNESPARENPLVHTATVTDIDLTYNLVCTNRRKQFVVYSA